MPATNFGQRKKITRNISNLLAFGIPADTVLLSFLLAIFAS